jgi:hypothetical protein
MNQDLTTEIISVGIIAFGLLCINLRMLTKDTE